MKKRVAILLVMTVMMTMVIGLTGFDTKEVTAAPAFQRINFVDAVVTAPGLNVRQGCSTSYPVVCVLRQGQTVKVFGKIGDWYAIYDPSSGCVGAAFAQYLKSPGWSATPAKTPAPVPAKTPTPAPTKATLTSPSPTPSPTPGTMPMQGVSDEEQQMLNLVNKARADAGVGPLAIDPDLQKVARLKAQDMVEKNYFSHQSPTYGSPFDMMRQFGISFKSAGENIAGNQTVQGAFNAWMNSEGHRKNILNGNFNYTGIGIVNGSQYGKIFVQQFIGR